jgi:hypothetical protein
MSSNPRQLPSAPIPLGRVDVAVNRMSEDSAPANIGQFASYGTYSADSQSHDKPLVLTLGNDIENGIKIE